MFLVSHPVMRGYAPHFQARRRLEVGEWLQGTPLREYKQEGKEESSSAAGGQGPSRCMWTVCEDPARGSLWPDGQR